MGRPHANSLARALAHTLLEQFIETPKGERVLYCNALDITIKVNKSFVQVKESVQLTWF